MLAWWQSRSPMLKGTWLMLASVMIFTVLLLLIRLVGESVSVFTLVVVRQVVMQVIILAVARQPVRQLLKTSNLRLQLWRSVLALASTLAIYVSFIYLPLALASAISFSAVLFVTLGAVLFLKEKVDGKTWAATIIGLVGVVIMLSPREGGELFYVLVSIGGAIVTAGTILTVRIFHPSESIGTVLTYQGALVLPVLLLVAFSAVIPLMMLTLAGFLFFQEHPEPTLLVGMLIVVGATLYTIRSNARLASERAAAEAMTAN